MILTTPVLDRPPREVLRWRVALFAVLLVSGFLITSLVSRLPTVRDLLDASTGEMGFLILGISSSSVVILPLSGYVGVPMGAHLASVGVFTTVVIAELVRFLRPESMALASPSVALSLQQFKLINKAFYRTIAPFFC